MHACEINPQHPHQPEAGRRSAMKPGTTPPNRDAGIAPTLDQQSGLLIAPFRPVDTLAQIDEGLQVGIGLRKTATPVGHNSEEAVQVRASRRLANTRA
jgi:hypothetical protein